MEEKKNKEEIIKELKESILDNFINSTYSESDRLQVSLNEEVDNWASGLNFTETLDFLSQYTQADYATLDAGLYDGVLEKKGFEGLVITLAYCLAEQDLYNDGLINSLQNWENVTDKKSKQLIKDAKKELERIKVIE